jgi:hypothetical protein
MHDEQRELPSPLFHWVVLKHWRGRGCAQSAQPRRACCETATGGTGRRARFPLPPPRPWRRALPSTPAPLRPRPPPPAAAGLESLGGGPLLLCRSAILE